MPNNCHNDLYINCHNDLYINGHPEDVDALLKLIGADKAQPEFDFNKVLPYPEKFFKLDDDNRRLSTASFEAKYGKNAKDGFNSGGYEWCLENWGTKWNAYQVARRDYLGVCVTFQTAWSPPQKIIIALAKMFPKCSINLEYFECGAGVCGGFTCAAEEDDYEDADADAYIDSGWRAGDISNEWSCNYHGIRGG